MSILTNTAISYKSFGKPQEVLELTETDMPALPPGQVRLKLLAAAIHPSDFGKILGKYGSLATLPAVAGREGVGEVVGVGKGVSTIETGARYRIPEAAGVWQQYADVDAASLAGRDVPRDLDPAAAANAAINPPTALLLLTRYPGVSLEQGDWIIQNAANSAVGLHVIQLARHFGFKSINIVRREELIQPLKDEGGDIVLLDDDNYPREIANATGGQNPRLALNSVGGESAIRLLKALAPGGTHITFGGATFEAVRFPTRQLIFDDMRLTGFWLDRWMRESGPDSTGPLFKEIYDFLQSGVLSVRIEKEYALKDFPEALAHAQQPRLGKLVFRG